ncbi:NMDA receptor synaptonuclear signaling and neuronal migration factor-like [Branchiostoma floridae x Branchiostoma belcheri]
MDRMKADTCRLTDRTISRVKIRKLARVVVGPAQRPWRGGGGGGHHGRRAYGLGADHHRRRALVVIGAGRLRPGGCSRDSLACLQHRKERREHREQPWTEDTPEYEDLQWKIVNELQLNIDTYKGDIVDLRWKAEQMQERADLAAHGALPPPRVVLISSTVPKAKFLPLTVKNEPDILVVSYDHQNDGFEKILGAVQTRMNSYCPGCKAKSLLLYIQGGPAHLYLKKNKVTTVAKLKKADGEDMVWFWKTLGCMMSKVDSKTTVIHIMGCNVMGFPKYVGIDLFEYLQELMKPSIVRFEAPLETSKKGKAVIESYFDANKYKLWKSQRYSILDRVFGL